MGANTLIFPIGMDEEPRGWSHRPNSALNYWQLSQLSTSRNGKQTTIAMAVSRRNNAVLQGADRLEEKENVVSY